MGLAKMTPQLVTELRASIQRTRKLLRMNDPLGHIEEDTHFHAAIASSTGNEALLKVLDNVQSQIWICRRKTYKLSSSTAPDAHEAILEALCDGNHRAAQSAMQEHILLVRERLVSFIKQQGLR